MMVEQEKGSWNFPVYSSRSLEAGIEDEKRNEPEVSELELFPLISIEEVDEMGEWGNENASIYLAVEWKKYDTFYWNEGFEVKNSF